MNLERKGREILVNHDPLMVNFFGVRKFGAFGTVDRWKK